VPLPETERKDGADSLAEHAPEAATRFGADGMIRSFHHPSSNKENDSEHHNDRSVSRNARLGR
jgi:hypothetical protein